MGTAGCSNLFLGIGRLGDRATGMGACRGDLVGTQAGVRKVRTPLGRVAGNPRPS